MKKLFASTLILAAGTLFSAANIDTYYNNTYDMKTATKIAYDDSWANLGFVQGGAQGDLINRTNDDSDTNPGLGGFSFDFTTGSSLAAGNIITVEAIQSDGSHGGDQNGWGFRLVANGDNYDLEFGQMTVDSGDAPSVVDAHSRKDEAPELTTLVSSVSASTKYSISVSSKGGRGNDNFSITIATSGNDSSVSTTTQSVAGFGLNGNKFGSFVLGGATNDAGDTTQYAYGKVEHLSIVPEPSAFGLIAGLGALALVASRRRRSRKAA